MEKIDKQLEDYIRKKLEDYPELRYSLVAPFPCSIIFDSALERIFGLGEDIREDVYPYKICWAEKLCVLNDKIHTALEQNESSAVMVFYKMIGEILCQDFMKSVEDSQHWTENWRLTIANSLSRRLFLPTDKASLLLKTDSEVLSRSIGIDREEIDDRKIDIYRSIVFSKREEGMVIPEYVTQEYH
ncbi:hypothetical protein ND864_17655 [Leptospira levettii]|uniref:hypothetical protein n=1 Tax=Leptospira levettii TaxID=2023178 RepID=UPI00223E29C4|nr:hypothetical protein [Leptospira levettii]MCW7467550.1 hypothetical protein [Leptospira levettii]